MSASLSVAAVVVAVVGSVLPTKISSYLKEVSGNHWPEGGECEGISVTATTIAIEEAAIYPIQSLSVAVLVLDDQVSSVSTPVHSDSHSDSD